MKQEYISLVKGLVSQYNSEMIHNELGADQLLLDSIIDLVSEYESLELIELSNGLLEIRTI